MNLLLSFWLTIPAAKNTHRDSLLQNTLCFSKRKVLVSSFSQKKKKSLLSPCSLKYFLYFFFGGIKCIKTFGFRELDLHYWGILKVRIYFGLSFWSVKYYISDYWSSFMVFLKDGDVLLDIIRGAHHHRYPLMDVLGLDVQDVGGPCGGHSSSLLHDEGHGVALIEKSELKWVKKFYKSLPVPATLFVQEHLVKASSYSYSSLYRL